MTDHVRNLNRRAMAGDQVLMQASLSALEDARTSEKIVEAIGHAARAWVDFWKPKAEVWLASNENTLSRDIDTDRMTRIVQAAIDMPDDESKALMHLMTHPVWPLVAAWCEAHPSRSTESR